MGGTVGEVESKLSESQDLAATVDGGEEVEERELGRQTVSEESRRQQRENEVT